MMVLRRFLAFALALTLLVSMSACQKEEKDPVRNVDMQALTQQLLSEVTYDTPLTYFGAEAAVLFEGLPQGSVVDLYAADMHQADLLAIITVPDSRDAEKAEASAKNYVKQLREQFLHTAPEEVDKIDQAVIWKNGRNVILCITEDVATARWVIDKAPAVGEQPATDAPTNAPTDKPTDAPTDAPTEPPTDAPTAPPTDAPTEPPTDAPTEAPTWVSEPLKGPVRVKVTADCINKRSGPGTGFASVGYAYNGDALTVTETAKANGYTWGKSNSGWICLEFTDFEKAYAQQYPDPNAPTEPPTDAPTEPPTDAPTEPPTDAPTEAPTWVSEPLKGPVRVKVTADCIHKRSGPGTGFASVGFAYNGDELTVTETAKGSGYTWGKYSGGWICLEFTNFKKAYAQQYPDPNAPTEPPTEPPTDPTGNYGPGYSYPGYDFSSGAVSDDWYSDVLFIGDSRVEGLRLSARSGDAHYFSKTAMNIFSVKSETCYDDPIGSTTLGNLLSSRTYGKIYIAFGINVAGYPTSSFSSQYRSVVNYVRSLQPNAIIILQAVLPVTSGYAGGPSYFKPAHLAEMNQVIAGCANGTDIFYVDPNPWFANQDGYLYSDLTGDGCHLTTSHYKTWANWISYIIGKNNIG